VLCSRCGASASISSMKINDGALTAACLKISRSYNGSVSHD
jgi:hypothetical protein